MMRVIAIIIMSASVDLNVPALGKFSIALGNDAAMFAIVGHHASAKRDDTIVAQDTGKAHRHKIARAKIILGFHR